MVGSRKEEGDVFSTQRKPFTCEEFGLGPWGNNALSKKLKEMKKTVSDFGKKELKELFSYMEINKLIPVIGIKEALKQLLAMSDPIPLADLCDAIGVEGVVPLRAKSADAATSPRIIWREANDPEAAVLATKTFNTAAMKLDELLRANTKVDTRDLSKMTMTLGQNATRLNSNWHISKPPKGFETPKEAMRRAGPRTDSIVLPSLKSAETKKTNEDKIMENRDFRSTFERMGLKGDVLEMALLRKKRSIMLDNKEQTERAGPELQQVRERSCLGAFHSKPLPKGWNSGTGTFTL